MRKTSLGRRRSRRGGRARGVVAGPPPIGRPARHRRLPGQPARILSHAAASWSGWGTASRVTRPAAVPRSPAGVPFQRPSGVLLTQHHTGRQDRTGLAGAPRTSGTPCTTGIRRTVTPLYPTFPYTNYTRDQPIRLRRHVRVPAHHPTRQRGESRARARVSLQLPAPAGRLALVVLPSGRVRARRRARRPVEPRRLPRARARTLQRLSRGPQCTGCHPCRRPARSGGLVLDWYAPSLASPHEAGVQHWSDDRHRHAVEDRGAVRRRRITVGPMAEVVGESLQHAPEDELLAMATYLKALPAIDPPAQAAAPQTPYVLPPADARARRRSSTRRTARLPWAPWRGPRARRAPPGGNRAVTMPSAVNPIRHDLFGGYPPGTAGNPRPYGMPPYSLTLSDEQIAEILDLRADFVGKHAHPVAARTSAPIAGTRCGECSHP